MTEWDKFKIEGILLRIIAALGSAFTGLFGVALMGAAITDSIPLPLAVFLGVGAMLLLVCAVASAVHALDSDL